MKKKMSASQIKNLRKSLGLTQEEMAHLIGVSFMSINRWERGKCSPSNLATKRLLEVQEERKKK